MILFLLKNDYVNWLRLVLVKTNPDFWLVPRVFLIVSNICPGLRSFVPSFLNIEFEFNIRNYLINYLTFDKQLPMKYIWKLYIQQVYLYKTTTVDYLLWMRTLSNKKSRRQIRIAHQTLNRFYSDAATPAKYV